MIIARIRFGRTHAVTAVGDVINDKQQVEISCIGMVELTPENRNRFKLFSGVPNRNLGCYECRRNLGIEEQNAD